MKRLITLSFVFGLLAALTASASDVKVRFSGLQKGDKAILSISSGTYLDNIAVESNGDYTFCDVPEGRHLVKAEAIGYEAIEALPVIVGTDGSVIPSEPLHVNVTLRSDDPDIWQFEWREDETPAGYTTTSHVNKPAEIEFLGKKIVPSDAPSAATLQNVYHIMLADDGEPWSQEYAYRLVETMKTLPLAYHEMPYYKFTLTASHLDGDMTVSQLGDGYEVTVSKDAFYYANPFLVSIDGVRGALFSKRLHHAMTNLVTDYGQNTQRANYILRERFGCEVMDINYEELTKEITNEDAGRFQPFVPSELVSIINMLEELPDGFHKTPHLKYLIRRINGMKHPIYPEAAAVSWPVENGYIEFMESAFGGNNQAFDILRLILHEKTHFLWAFSFSDEIKRDWAEVGGWYEVPGQDGHPNGWATTKDAEFVSAYAHAHNPDEDMAESVAFYLKNPDKLMSRSSDKYAFIRDRIMHGTRYISKIPDHLTFEVLNLHPDYDYPGKIRNVTVRVEGAPDYDKQVTVDLWLHDLEGFDDGASGGHTRITSPAFTDTDGRLQYQLQDISFVPVDGDDHHLRGKVTISRYSKSGHWSAGDFVITDIQGNQRFEGRNDCVFDLYVNSPIEDLESPQYGGDLRYKITETTIEGHHAQNLEVRYKLSDNIGIQSVYCGIHRGGAEYTYQKYGTYEPETGDAVLNVPIPDFYPSGDYWLVSAIYSDLAGNTIYTYFTDSPEDQPIQKVHVTTPTPDLEPAEIDVNRISVYAEPTHPEAPDGETLVTINFYARDDISGFGECNYKLRDPQGIDHFQWFYHRNSSGMYFNGDPTVWERYTIKCVLPQGSAPGIWGLSEIATSDKAGNDKTYNFVETLIFQPDDSDDYILFAELDENDILSLGLQAATGTTYGFTWRVIHEESGQELSGASSETAAKTAGRARLQRVDSCRGSDIDVSSLPDGELVVIVTALDETGEVASVKTTRLKKGGELSVNVVNAPTGPYIVDVYNLQGICVRRNAPADRWNDGLPAGIYIVNGMKILIR